VTRIALIRPLCLGDESEFQEPLGIERLAGFLTERGIEVNLFDRRLDGQRRLAGKKVPVFFDYFAACFVKQVPDAIGFSLMTAEDLPDTLRMISRLRVMYPETLLVAGGLYISTVGEQATSQFPSYVKLIAHQGEWPLLELLVGKKSQQSLPCYTPNNWAQPLRPYLQQYLELGCSISLHSSSGCIGSCTFCATPEFPNQFNCWQAREIPLVVNEIETLTARVEQLDFLPVFNFVDDCFGALDRLEQLDQELRRRDLDIAYALQLRIDSLIGEPNLEQRLKQLKAGGLTRLFTGVESLNTETLSSWNKLYKTEQLPEVINALKTARIQTHIGYIMWHANSTVEGAKQEAKQLMELGLFSVKCAESRMMVFPGSRAYCQLGSDIQKAAFWEPMSDEAESYYASLIDYLQPIYEVWIKAATISPMIGARAHLTNDYSVNDKLDVILATCNYLAYDALETEKRNDSLPSIAADLLEKIGGLQIC
jgi:radical SAM superfamily enzyme YgiQ (UPF0313 family)